MNEDKLIEMQAIANVMHTVLSMYPESDLIDTFKSQNIADSWPRLSNSADELQGLQYLKQYLENWQNTEDELIQLKLDYGQLFFGPGTPQAAPWGSAYTSTSLLLNDRTTVELKAFYTANGIKIDLNTNEPIDHIGLIVAVLAFLLEQMISNAGDSSVKGVMKSLLQDHLLPWGDRCLELAVIHAKTDFFKGFSILFRECFLRLAQIFEITPKSIAIYR